MHSSFILWIGWRPLSLVTMTDLCILTPRRCCICEGLPDSSSAATVVYFHCQLVLCFKVFCSHWKQRRCCSQRLRCQDVKSVSHHPWTVSTHKMSILLWSCWRGGTCSSRWSQGKEGRNQTPPSSKRNQITQNLSLHFLLPWCILQLSS